MAGGSNGYPAALVGRQLTLGLISSLPGRPDRRPLSFFRQATLSWTLPRDVLCVELATTGRLFRGRPSNLAHGLGAARSLRGGNTRLCGRLMLAVKFVFRM